MIRPSSAGARRRRQGNAPTGRALATKGAASEGGAARSGDRRLPLVLFLLLVMGGGLVIGWLTAPDEWYAQLDKPPFNPPGWLFAPVWTVLYVLIAVAGWRVWRRDAAARPMQLWWTQLVLNFTWSPIFFAAHRIDLALIVIIALLVAIVAFIAASWRRERTSAWLFVPYAAWVTFATALNASILVLN